MGMAPYSSMWETHRKLFGRHMSWIGVRVFYPVLEKESALCALRVLENPEAFVAETRL